MASKMAATMAHFPWLEHFVISEQISTYFKMWFTFIDTWTIIFPEI